MLLVYRDKLDEANVNREILKVIIEKAQEELVEDSEPLESILKSLYTTTRI